MATLKQQTAIKKTLENLGKNQIKPLGKVMIESGYKKSVAKNPKILTKSKAWEEVLKEVDYNKHVRELDELASIKNNEDKDNVLKAKKMLFDLGDKFPAQKSKVMGLFQAIDDLKDEH